MYRAPVEEIAFTLKHVAGLQAALMLLGGRHGLSSPSKMHASCQPPNKFGRYDKTPGALARGTLYRCILV